MQSENANQLIDQWINDVSTSVNYWELMSNVGLSLTIAVAVLGILLTTSNNFSEKSCKKFSTLIGLIISVITVVLNIVFYNDYRVYDKLHNEGYRVLQNMQIYKNKYNGSLNPENQNTFFEKIMDLRFKIMDLKESASPKNTLDDVIGFIIPSSYAKSLKKPHWIESPSQYQYEDKDGYSKIYFIGNGGGFVIDNALDNAMNDALSNIDFFLSEEVYKDDSKKFFQQMKDIIIKENQFIEGDDNNGYNIYILISIKREKINSLIDYFHIAHGYDFDGMSYTRDKVKIQNNYIFDKPNYSNLENSKYETTIQKLKSYVKKGEELISAYESMLESYKSSLEDFKTLKAECYNAQLNYGNDFKGTIFDFSDTCNQNLKKIGERLAERGRLLDNLANELITIKKNINSAKISIGVHESFLQE